MFLFPTDIPRVTLPLTRFCLNQNKRRLTTHSAALLAPCFAFCLVPRFCSPSGTASTPFLHRFLARPASRSCLFGMLSCSPFGTPFCSPFGNPYCSPLGTLFSILFGAWLLQPVWQVVLQLAARLAPFQQSVLGTYLAGHLHLLFGIRSIISFTSTLLMENNQKT